MKRRSNYNIYIVCGCSEFKQTDVFKLSNFAVHACMNEGRQFHSRSKDHAKDRFLTFTSLTVAELLLAKPEPMQEEP